MNTIAYTQLFVQNFQHNKYSFLKRGHNNYYMSIFLTVIFMLLLFLLGMNLIVPRIPRMLKVAIP